ncbi:hypothetical protein EI94DRAFT_1735936, partial [Lactarius quietus]
QRTGYKACPRLAFITLLPVASPSWSRLLLTTDNACVFARVGGMRIWGQVWESLRAIKGSPWLRPAVARGVEKGWQISNPGRAGRKSFEPFKCSATYTSPSPGISRGKSPFLAP